MATGSQLLGSKAATADGKKSWRQDEWRLCEVGTEIEFEKDDVETEEGRTMKS